MQERLQLEQRAAAEASPDEVRVHQAPVLATHAPPSETLPFEDVQERHLPESGDFDLGQNPQVIGNELNSSSVTHYHTRSYLGLQPRDMPLLMRVAAM